MDSITLYKLMTLYMLNKMNSTLTNEQVSGFFMNKGYANYFTVQQVLDDMINQNYIKVDSFYNASHYSITSLGKETLKLLEQNLSFAIKSDINDYISDNKFDFTIKNSVTAEYKNAPNGDVIAHLRALDGSTTLIDINVTCVNDTQAQTFCSNWKDASYDIYTSIIKNLS